MVAKLGATRQTGRRRPAPAVRSAGYTWPHARVPHLPAAVRRPLLGLRPAAPEAIRLDRVRAARRLDLGLRPLPHRSILPTIEVVPPPPVGRSAVPVAACRGAAWRRSPRSRSCPSQAALAGGVGLAAAGTAAAIYLAARPVVQSHPSTGVAAATAPASGPRRPRERVTVDGSASPAGPVAPGAVAARRRPFGRRRRSPPRGIGAGAPRAHAPGSPRARGRRRAGSRRHARASGPRSSRRRRPRHGSARARGRSRSTPQHQSTTSPPPSRRRSRRPQPKPRSPSRSRRPQPDPRRRSRSRPRRHDAHGRSRRRRRQHPSVRRRTPAPSLPDRRASSPRSSSRRSRRTSTPQPHEDRRSSRAPVDADRREPPQPSRPARLGSGDDGRPARERLGRRQPRSHGRGRDRPRSGPTTPGQCGDGHGDATATVRRTATTATARALSHASRPPAAFGDEPALGRFARLLGLVRGHDPALAGALRPVERLVDAAEERGRVVVAPELGHTRRDLEARDPPDRLALDRELESLEEQVGVLERTTPGG